MPLTRLACTHCGHWHLWFDGSVPPQCRVCSDVRNALPEDGFRFAGVAEVAAGAHNVCEEVLPGVFGVRLEPALGLGSTGWVIERADGNVAFEAAPWYDEAALAFIAARGGLRVASCSHVHGMGALWQLQQRFEPEIPMHVNALRDTKALRVTRPIDDVHEIAPGLVLHHVGGHYEGQCVMHDSAHNALFAGDTLKIDLHADGTPRALSCHKAFHYRIPLTPAELRRYAEVFSRLPFEHVFTPFEHAAGVTREHALALFDRLLAGVPSTDPVMMELLR